MREKKKYTKPIMGIEEFVPQEYVAVCYAIACIASYKGTDKPMDHSGSCSSLNNQYITEESEGVYSMFEKSPDQGKLTCYFPPYNDYYDIKQGGSKTITGLYTGQEIEWRTYASNNDGRAWTHIGIVNLTDPGRSSNHS